MVASTKITAFCDTAPCSLSEVKDVSEVRTASIIRTMIALMIEANYTALYP
jgi:hypothetical protein